MGLIESLYEADQIFSGFKNNQNFGIAPNPVIFSILNGINSLKVLFEISDTIIEDVKWCEVKGVLIRIKPGSAPVDIYDGDLVGDYTGSDLTSHRLNAGIPIVINGLVNNIQYYVRFFPYSLNGVYNLSLSNIGTGVPKDVLIYGFHQNFLDLNPDTTITYLEESVNFQPMVSREDNNSGLVLSNGGWNNWEWLQKNLPYMVRKTGVADYQLDPNDYTKKLDGSVSDISNTSYDGGAFAWLPKLYMKEVYSADGNSRDVYFAESNSGLYTSDFYPVGFVDPSNQVMEGVWLPMFYIGQENISLALTTISNSRKMIELREQIETFSIRGRFLGGPLMNLIRDVMYMLYRNTDIQKYAGYGYSNFHGVGVEFVAPTNNQYITLGAEVIDPHNGRFCGTGRGFYDSGSPNTPSSFDKAFHSSVLISYVYGLYDPYLCAQKVDGINNIYLLTNYNIIGLFPDITNYVLTSYHPTVRSPNYPTKMIQLSSAFGSIPDIASLAGSSITGLCDKSGYLSGGSVANTGIKYCSRLLYATADTNERTTGAPGIGSIFGEIAYDGFWYSTISAAVLLLPEIGYKPN